jgi:hypothetical protein
MHLSLNIRESKYSFYSFHNRNISIEQFLQDLWQWFIHYVKIITSLLMHSLPIPSSYWLLPVCTWLPFCGRCYSNAGKIVIQLVNIWKSQNMQWLSAILLLFIFWMCQVINPVFVEKWLVQHVKLSTGSCSKCIERLQSSDSTGQQH